MKALGRLPPEERPAVGEAANRAKTGIESAVAARLAALDEAELAEDLARVVDVTLPARGRAAGDAAPADAGPARDRGDLPGPRASRCAPAPGLRPSGTTSTRSTRRPTTPRATCRTPSSSRAGASCARTPRRCRSAPCWPAPPPVRIIAPGNVFRRDDDATHTPMFPQMEGLLVDERRLVRRAEGDAAALRAPLLRPRAWACACAPATSRSPSRRPRSTPPATCATAGRQVDARGLPALQGQRLD